MLEVIDSGVCSAHENMLQDRTLLEKLQQKAPPLLRYYKWKEGSASYGYFLDPMLCLDRRALESHGLQLVRRPTGGGIIFHLWDFTFSFFLPAKHPCFFSKTLKNYAFVNSIVMDALKDFNPELQKTSLTPLDYPKKDAQSASFCMARPTKYDVVIQGKKLAGAAQRRTCRGYLHQGSIAFKRLNKRLLKDVLGKYAYIQDMMENYNHPIWDEEGEESEELARKRLQKSLTKSFVRALSV